MTLTMPVHRVLDPEEVLLLIRLDEFRPTRTKAYLKPEEMDGLVTPWAINEKFLLDSEYLARVKAPGDKEIANSIVITELGRLAIGRLLRQTIDVHMAKLDTERSSGRVAAESLKGRVELLALLRSYLDGYPVRDEARPVKAAVITKPKSKPARDEDHPSEEPEPDGAGVEPDEPDGAESDSEDGNEDPRPKKREPLRSAPARAGQRPTPRRRR